MVFGLAEKRIAKIKAAEQGQPSVKVSRSDLFIDPKESYLTAEKIDVIFIKSNVEVDEAIQKLLSKCTVLGLDIETLGLSEFAGDKQAGLDPRKSGIRLVQIFDGAKTVFVFDILKLGGIAVLGKDIWKKPMIAHNAMFELKHLLFNGAHPEKLGCTLLIDRVITGNRIELKDELGLSKKAGLKDLAKELLNLDVSKELQTSDWSIETLTPEQIEYAALDAVLTAKIFAQQSDTLKSKGLARSYKILRDAQQGIARMELAGIGFNVPEHKKRILDWQKESDTLEDEILKAIGKELNLNSGKQLGVWLNETFEEEDLEDWAKTGKGRLKTNTDTFKLNERMHDIFPKLVEYRHVAKRISSFGDSFYKFIDVTNNRLYGSFSLGTTTTGRMASSKPNMQNMPRTKFRDLFCAKEGFVLVGADFSQQELRVAALVSKDKALLKIYEDGEDAHINTAAMILSIPKEQVKKEHRQLAKALNFGLLYGQGAPGLALYAKRNYGVELSLEEAKKYRDTFFGVYKGLRQWQRETGGKTEITKKISTPCGRVRDFSREKLGYRFTAALNLPIQGAAAEITLCALIRLIPLISEDCQIVNIIHDEILLEVREDLAEFYAEKVKQAMEAAFLDVFPDAKLYLKGLIDAKTGKNWAETK